MSGNNRPRFETRFCRIQNAPLHHPLGYVLSKEA